MSVGDSPLNIASDGPLPVSKIPGYTGSKFSIPGTDIVFEMKDVVGPFIIGFMLEMLFTGVISVLSINYFVYIRPSLTAEAINGSPARRTEGRLILITLGVTLACAGISLARSYDIFAAHALELFYLYNVSEVGSWILNVLNLIPTVVNQSFLTVRAFKFLTVSEVLWPRLSRSLLRYVFAAVIVCLMVAECVGSFMQSYYTFSAKTLLNLAPSTSGSTKIYHAGLTYTICAVTADVLITVVLTGQLWWARRKLASSVQGGTAGRIVQRLMFVIFHAGLLQTVLQISQLLCFKFAVPWTYLPASTLPKIYAITLILAISAPHIVEPASTPSNIQLPTIHLSTFSAYPPAGLSARSTSRTDPQSRFPTSSTWRSRFRRPYPWSTTMHQESNDVRTDLHRMSAGKYSRQQDHPNTDGHKPPYLSVNIHPPSLLRSDSNNSFIYDKAGPSTPATPATPPTPATPAMITHYVHPTSQSKLAETSWDTGQTTSQGSMRDSTLFWMAPIPGLDPPSPCKVERRRSDSMTPMRTGPAVPARQRSTEAVLEAFDLSPLRRSSVDHRLILSSPAAIVARRAGPKEDEGDLQHKSAQ
ncbi:hypothetical protein BD324DRAFT_652639 [Kockovaella imperatae]|uniref:Uncharacterized protein n=1 Tax=Kockovaella imperatae TaxID=4999 RepID=A0A1Y1UBL3_9TREE|nr:hypothetical protein BD324DRAFT_652639 [Kockovaella imperatae]ORX34917.1 hypothetical protein BD324DRAFT_652639 [Kockovaella imperatae]